MSAGELILYRTEDGRAEIHLRLEGDTAWLTQAEMAELFDTTPQAITQHIRAIYEEGELGPEATCKDSLQVRQEGERRVRRRLKAYSLPMILAVGYRVRSPRGTQFRQWATAHLEEYLVKGFAMNDERLKEPGGWDYFDELLARIRDIRASEKRFYQKVRDLFALSSDYRSDDQEANRFFAEVQNKLLYAVTGHTAAEIVVNRADPGEPNMALTNWQGARVRKQDVTVAKNYLSADEVDTLNRLVVIFLEQAELRARERQDLTLDYWRHNVDRLLEFNERPILDGAGSISRDRMEHIAHKRYEQFDARRRRDEALEADAEELRELEALEERIKKEGDK
ncbi:virulence RhuM family protein [Arhodomonas sp. KWT2]